jgi:hypothetical protein
MTIIGFNFRKITAERPDSVTGKINISNNVTLRKVEEANIPVGKDKQRALKFGYAFETKYEPKAGSILIEGEVIYLAPEDVVDKTLKGWKKDKKVDKEILQPILNSVLSKCSIKGLMLSQDLNMPSPLQLPRVTVK